MAASAKVVDVSAPLWRIVERGDADALARLLPRVADVNARNRHGMTLLMKAASCGDARIVRLLLEHGADPNLTRNDKFTALALAAFFGHSVAVKTLLEFGAHSDAVTRCGASARTWATARTFAEVARCLETTRTETPPLATVQLKNRTPPKRIVVLGVCASVVLVVCFGLGALILKKSEAQTLPIDPVKPVSIIEPKVVTPPPVVEPVVDESAAVIPPPVKTETHVRPVIKRLAPSQREVKSIQELSVAPEEPVQNTKQSAVAAPRFESPKPASPKPAALSPQIIAPSKKAKVIQWP